MGSNGSRFMGSIGFVLGCILLLGGVLLVSGQLLWESILPYISGFSFTPTLEGITAAPVWIGWGILFIGLLIFAWGFGLVQTKDWAPFVTITFFIHLGIYVSVAIALAYSGQLQWFRMAGLSTGSGLVDQLGQVSIILLPGILAFMIGLLVLFRSSAVLNTFEAKYLTHPSTVAVCPNSDCRSLLPPKADKCPRCNPQYRLIQLVSSETGHVHDIRFTPENLVVRLSRYDENVRETEESTVYFRVDASELFKKISQPHAEVRYDDDDGAFFIQDLGSFNRTYVNDADIAEGSDYELRDGDIIRLGPAEFTLSIPMTEV